MNECLIKPLGLDETGRALASPWARGGVWPNPV